MSDSKQRLVISDASSLSTHGLARILLARPEGRMLACGGEVACILIDDRGCSVDSSEALEFLSDDELYASDRVTLEELLKSLRPGNPFLNWLKDRGFKVTGDNAGIAFVTVDE